MHGDVERRGAGKGERLHAVSDSDGAAIIPRVVISIAVRLIAGLFAVFAQRLVTFTRTARLVSDKTSNTGPTPLRSLLCSAHWRFARSELLPSTRLCAFESLTNVQRAEKLISSLEQQQ